MNGDVYEPIRIDDKVGKNAETFMLCGNKAFNNAFLWTRLSFHSLTLSLKIDSLMQITTNTSRKCALHDLHQIKTKTKVVMNNLFNHATRMQAPPTSLIFSSALRLKNFALTITGCLGSRPFPSTLK